MIKYLFNLVLFSAIIFGTSIANGDTEVDQLVSKFVEKTWIANSARNSFALAREIRDLGIERKDRELELRGLVRLAYADVYFGKWKKDTNAILQKCMAEVRHKPSLAAAEVFLFRGHLKGNWLDDLPGGLRDLEEAIFISRQLRQDYLLALTYLRASELLIKSNSYDRALDYSFRALEIAETENNKALLRMAIYRVISVISITGRYDDAAPYARRLKELMPDSLLGGYVLFKAGENPNFGESLVKRINRLASEEETPTSLDKIGNRKSKLADVRRAQGRFPEALALTEQALSSFHKTGNLRQIDHINYKRLLIRIEMGDPTVEESDVIEMVDNHGVNDRSQFSADAISRLYEKAGEYETALQWMHHAERTANVVKKVGIQEKRKMAAEFWNSELRSRSQITQLLAQQHRAQQASFGFALFALMGIAVAVIGLIRNRMIKANQDELEQLVVARTASLERARETAELADAAKGEFLARINHEIRNPLTAILGYCDLIELKTDGETSRELPIELPVGLQNYVSGLRSSSDHLLELVSDVLELSKIEQCQFETSPENFSLTEFCSDVEEMLVELSGKKGIEFHCRLDSKCIAEVYADETILKQILINLITNSIKATTQGFVHATISTYQNDDNSLNLELSVEDSGCGISSSDQKKIFEPFVQLDAKEKTAGKGLGLHITKSLVKHFDGSLRLQSEIGVGTRINVSIPIQAQIQSSQPAEPTATENLREQRILVVDDLEEIREIVCIQLTAMGHQAKSSEGLAETIDAIQSWQPTLVLLDLRMPVHSGFDVISAIKAQIQDPPPVIAMTGDATAEVRSRVFESGFDGFLTKPFSMDRVTQAFVDAIEATDFADVK